MKILSASVIAIAVLLSVGLREAGADFYRYVDEDGVVHITNVPSSAKFKWMMSERATPKPDYFENIPNNRKFDSLIHSTAVRYGVDPKLVKAIVKAESDFEPTAVSPVGARGLMQLMPETARLMGVKDAHDPEDNVEGGIRYLSKLLKMFNWNLTLAIAAYNAGENAVLKYGAVPPYSETRKYVKRVLFYYDQYGSRK